MAGQTVVVSVLADTKKFSKAFQDLGEQTGLSRLSTGVAAIGKAVAVGTAAAAAGVVAFGVSAQAAASNLQQSIGGVDAVFKENAAQVHAWAASAAKDLGLSKNSYNELATVIGSQLKNMGVSSDQVTGKTSDLIKMGADLSAQFGGSTSDAVGALSSLLRGETDPIERYGVSIKQADINSKMAAMGLSGLTGEAEKSARTQATLALLTEQTASAQGAFSRESGTWANVQQRLGAQLTNIGAKVGTYLLPALTKAGEYVERNLQPAFDTASAWVKDEGLPAFQRLSAWFQEQVQPRLAAVGEVLTGKVLPAFRSVGQWVAGSLVPALVDLGGWVVKNKDWLSALGVMVLTVVAGIKAYNIAMAAWKVVQTAGIAIQTAWNVVMAANPIGIIILAIAALVAGLVYFFTQTETGKAIWAGFSAALSAGWEWIKDAFASGYEAVKGFLEKAWAVIQTVWSYSPLGLIITNWDAIMAFFRAIPGRVGAFFGEAIAVIQRLWSYTPLGAIVTNWGAIMTFLGSIPTRIAGAFGGAGRWLYDAGKDVIQGLLDGVNAVLGKVRDVASNIASAVTGPVKKLLGIHSPSRVFRQIGRYTLDGLAAGLRELGGVQSAMVGVSGAVTGGFTPGLSLDVGAASTSAGAPTYNITVQTLVPTAEAGRVVADALRAHERLNGRR